MPTDKRAKRSIWTYLQEEAPGVPREGETWYKESTGIGHMFDGTDWQPYNFCRDLSMMYHDAYMNQTPNNISGVDHLYFGTDAIASIASTLTGSSSRQVSSAFASLTNGYWLGGWNSTASLRLTTVDKLDFSSASIGSITSTLVGMWDGGIGLESKTTGYTGFRGTIHTLGSMTKLLFVNDSTSSFGTTILIREGCGALSAEEQGYSFGGQPTGSANDPTTTIQKMLWSTEVISSLTTGLTQQTTSYPACFNSTTNGYRMGGGWASSGLPVVGSAKHVEKLRFSDETMSSLTSIIEDRGRPGDGVQSLTGGYCFGGNSYPATYRTDVVRLEYSDDSTSTLISTLTASAPFSSGADANFEGVRFW